MWLSASIAAPPDTTPIAHQSSAKAGAFTEDWSAMNVIPKPTTKQTRDRIERSAEKSVATEKLLERELKKRKLRGYERKLGTLQQHTSI
jgi:hypothetical protein